MRKDFLFVIVGGAVGTALRLMLDILLSLIYFDEPLASIMIINAVGSLLLGFLVGGIWTRHSTPHWLKLFIGPGLLGAFTTFSGVMLQSMFLQNVWATAGFIALSVGTSLFAALIGIWLGSPFATKARRVKK